MQLVVLKTHIKEIKIANQKIKTQYEIIKTTIKKVKTPIDEIKNGFSLFFDINTIN